MENKEVWVVVLVLGFVLLLNNNNPTGNAVDIYNRGLSSGEVTYPSQQYALQSPYNIFKEPAQYQVTERGSGIAPRYPGDYAYPTSSPVVPQRIQGNIVDQPGQILQNPSGRYSQYGGVQAQRFRTPGEGVETIRPGLVNVNPSERSQYSQYYSRY